MEATTSDRMLSIAAARASKEPDLNTSQRRLESRFNHSSIRPADGDCPRCRLQIALPSRVDTSRRIARRYTHATMLRAVESVGWMTKKGAHLKLGLLRWPAES